ncbi:MAG: ABC transporter substrate-binding protein [Gemmatimonadota bacterium]
MTAAVRLALALACLAAGCSPPAERSEAARSTVTISYEEAWLDPESDMPAKFLWLLPLTALDEGGDLEPRLARSWEHSPDWREWTYRLRTDVRWHDGMPVTAHDVEHSVRLWHHPDVLHYYTAFVESATALDDSTVRIRYTPAADLSIASYLAFWPKHVVEKLDPKRFYAWDFWTHPVGNGPYRFVRYLPGTAIEFERNPDYVLERPRIERVILRFTGAEGLTALLGGEVDAVSWTDPGEISKLAADPRFRVYFAPESYRGYAILWNASRPLFADPRVRRALTLAIDRRGLLRALNLPDWIPVVDAPFTDRQLRRGELPASLPYDPAEASRFLDAAGWRDLDGDGIREKDGRPFRFTALIFGDERRGVFIQAELRRVGVRVDLQPLDRSSAFERIRAGDFEAAVSTYDNNPGSLASIALGKGPPLGYRNQRVAELVALAAATSVPDERDGIYRELAAILREDLPITFLFPRVDVVIAQRRLRGLREPWRVDPAWHMEDLWIEED